MNEATEKAWDEIGAAYERGESIEGVITARVRGGLAVTIRGCVKAFLPASQVDLRPVLDPDAYLNQTLEFKVLQFNRRRGNIMLSRRVLLEGAHHEETIGITWRLRGYLGGSGTAMTSPSELNDAYEPVLYDVLRDAANEIDCLNAEIARLIGRASSHRRISDDGVEDLVKGVDAAARHICELTAELGAKEQDHAHLLRLYAESRDYVGTLEKERDDLVASSRRNVAEINRLEAEVESLRKGTP